MKSSGTLMAREDVVREIALRPRHGERVVLTNGCFDLLHPGHLDVLRQAHEHGDCLVVAVNTDESVRRLKGVGRPVTALAERMELLAAVRWVDYVVSFAEETPIEVVRELQPEVYAKGADWRSRPLIEADLARELGGEVVFLDLLPGYSTTQIIDRIRAIPLGDSPR